ncbi:small ribosomal subunit protein uS13c-like [Malania oleifera]|uniref:small ribosomal subunit protein uS13c-like n=1 Tax=Malania oleifera TaxID=397392 RepID=UPI0025AEC174|nr:small ribosomal subunit protein uS13c-like [Malania oleifera]XP_057973756.1 small ribosomal subunit protein uS13c-like [Malania oleifera]XP_057973757.1 small ribosomal subunit protein uS13c-like [Malania oleifera]XP_057973758.1 small ribosomal subunit protein uS13c-like [Malania oleifera]XP_057973759.1 small ribosomal subunit protein uS13c-like [Malania oleifera]
MAHVLAMPVASSLSVICNGRSPSPLLNSVGFSTASPPKVRGISIKCVRVGGVEIPNNKRVEYSLQYIHGIGRSRSRQVLCDLGMQNKITKDLSEEELISLRDEVSKYMIEGDLRRFNAMAIRRLKEIQCYRGIRHIKGLPCRGQRTKNNCRTLKGKRVAIAGKKKAAR